MTMSSAQSFWGGVATAILLTGSSAPSAFCGDTTALPQEVALEKLPESNPLSFFDGRVTLDVQERLRWEVRENNFDFNSGVQSLTDDNWFLNRFRIGLLLKPMPWLKLYAQGQDSREWDSDRANLPGVLGAEGDDSFDLRQAYVEFGDPKRFPLLLKVGRQVLSYGDERLVGGFDWNNIGRTFDAAKLRWEEKTWSLDAFAASVVVPKTGSFNRSDFINNEGTQKDQLFTGLYYTNTALTFQSTDLYALYLSEDGAAPQGSGETAFVTLGSRVKSKPGAFQFKQAAPPDSQAGEGKSAPPATPSPAPLPAGFDYAAEMAFQTGRVGGLDLAAFALAAGVGYTFDAPWLPRLGAEYSYASGDRDVTDGSIETFQNLFPTNHKFYGIMDLTAWQNMHQATVGISAQPSRTLTALVDYRAFFIASTDDVWYRANGTTPVRPLTPAAREAGQYEGSQIEVVLSWSPRKFLQVQAGYAHFFPGEYLKATGPADAADFGYVMTTITF